MPSLGLFSREYDLIKSGCVRSRARLPLAVCFQVSFSRFVALSQGSFGCSRALLPHLRARAARSRARAAPAQGPHTHRRLFRHHPTEPCGTHYCYINAGLLFNDGCCVCFVYKQWLLLTDGCGVCVYTPTAIWVPCMNTDCYINTGCSVCCVTLIVI